MSHPAVSRTVPGRPAVPVVPAPPLLPVLKGA